MKAHKYWSIGAIVTMVGTLRVKSSTQILCIWLSDMHDYGSLFWS